MRTIKEQVETAILENIKRDGHKEIIKFLAESDFYDAPASTQFHGVNPGDLARHSLSVYNILKNKNADYELGYSDETIAISGLFHDLCKVNFYKEKPTEPATDAQLRYLESLSGINFKEKNVTKDIASKLIEQYKNNIPGVTVDMDAKSWIVEDMLPMGHGEKSVYIVNKFMQLKDEEALAIRWHMAMFDPGVHFNYPSGYPFRHASEDYPLLAALFTSDYEADKLLKI